MIYCSYRAMLCVLSAGLLWGYSVNSTAADMSNYQSKSLSPAHRAELQREIQSCKARVSQASGAQQWGEAMEELCKQLLQAEQYDEALDVAQKVTSRQGVDPERRAALHYLIAQIHVYKMEASPSAGEMQNCRKQALMTVDEILKSQYPAKWGITDAAQKLQAKLGSQDYMSNIGAGIAKRQTTGNGGTTQWRTGNAKARGTAELDNRTGQVTIDRQFMDQLSDNTTNNYGEAPSLSGGNVRSSTQNSGTTTKEEFEKAKRGETTNQAQDTETPALPAASYTITGSVGRNSYAVQNEPGYLGPDGKPSKTSSSNGRGLLKALGNYKPYPNVPNLNKPYEERGKITDPLKATSINRSTPINPNQLSTAQRALQTAGRTPDMSRYGDAPGESTRAYINAKQQEDAARSRTKRPAVYNSRNEPADDVIAPSTTQRSNGGLLIDGEQVKGQ